MVNAISSSAASYVNGSMPTAPVQSVQSSGASQSTPKPAPQSDTVTLSAAAQAHAMQQQGMAVKTIAANMGITAQAVDSYLGISSSSGGAGGGGGTSEIAKIASRVRVNPPAGGDQS